MYFTPITKLSKIRETFVNVHVTEGGDHIPVSYWSRDAANLWLNRSFDRQPNSIGAYRINVKPKAGE